MEKVVGQRLAMLKDRAFERRKRRVEFTKKFQKWLSVVPVDRLIKWYMDVDGNEMCIRQNVFFKEIPPEAVLEFRQMTNEYCGVETTVVDQTVKVDTGCITIMFCDKAEDIMENV